MQQPSHIKEKSTSDRLEQHKNTFLPPWLLIKGTGDRTVNKFTNSIETTFYNFFSGRMDVFLLQEQSTLTADSHKHCQTVTSEKCRLNADEHITPGQKLNFPTHSSSSEQHIPSLITGSCRHAIMLLWHHRAANYFDMFTSHCSMKKPLSELEKPHKRS